MTQKKAALSRELDAFQSSVYTLYKPVQMVGAFTQPGP